MKELQAKGGVFVPFPSRTNNPFAMAPNYALSPRAFHRGGKRRYRHVRSRALAWVAYGVTRLTKTPFVTTFPSVREGSNPIARRYNSVLARGDVLLADPNFAACLAVNLHPPAAGKPASFLMASIASSRRMRLRPPVCKRREGTSGRASRANSVSRGTDTTRQRPQNSARGGGTIIAKRPCRGEIHLGLRQDRKQRA